MTMTSFDLVSDFDGSIQKTFNDVDFDSAVVNSIHNLGYALLTTESNGLLECSLVQTDSGDAEKEFVSYSIDAANIEALTLLGHSIFESLTEAELNSINKFEEEEEEAAWSDVYDNVKEGKIVAFEL